MASKKKLKKKIELLEYELTVKSDRIALLARVAKAAADDLNMWRKKYELSQLTPEVKVDTEAAFKRGANYAVTSMRNELISFIQRIEATAHNAKENSNA